MPGTTVPKTNLAVSRSKAYRFEKVAPKKLAETLAPCAVSSPYLLPRAWGEGVNPRLVAADEQLATGAEDLSHGTVAKVAATKSRYPAAGPVQNRARQPAKLKGHPRGQRPRPRTVLRGATTVPPSRSICPALRVTAISALNLYCCK